MPSIERPLAPRRPRREDPALPALEVQLATLVREPPAGDDWVFEIKYDGYRAIAYVEASGVRLVSRNGLSFADRFAPVCRALRSLRVRQVVLDGEVCSLDPSGRTRFEALQGVLRDGTASELVYFVFDVLWLDGEDLRDRPLVERKAILERILPRTDAGTVRRGEWVLGGGESFLDAARRLGLEGLVAKRASAPYRAGRSLDWQKVKVELRDELAIVGWTPPKGSRQRFGALLLATTDPRSGVLRYAGKVGTGFDTAMLEDLHARMAPLRVASPPVADPPRERGATWIAPHLVAEIRFTEWTSDGRLRHPTFLGLREDKRADEVRREEPANGGRRSR
jgi:bifunctional non-homologous end joining protein LigD